MYIYKLHNCSKSITTEELLCGVICASEWGIVFADNGFGEYESVSLQQSIFSISGGFLNV